MFKFGTLFLCLSLTSMLLSAQQGKSGNFNIPEGMKFTIQGSVVDASTQTPVEYANVILYSQRDSSMIGGGITDSEGKFFIEIPRPGRFYMVVQFIGYEKYTLNGLMLNPQSPTLSLKPISINPVTVMLQEAVITDRRNEIIYKIDKKVVQVASNPNAVGTTAAEVLENTPGFEVDDEGNVRLRGSENFTVLINGKPTVLSGNDALKQIPASSIENIEIITNPSARYDPDGLTGIINIILKKDHNTKGFNGMVDISVGNRDRYSASINGNYRINKHLFTLGYDFNQGFRGGEGFSDRRTHLTNDTLHRVETSQRFYRTYRNSIRGGYDWDISEKTTFGLTGMFQFGNDKRYSESNQELTSTSFVDTAFRLSKTNEKGYRTNFDLNTTLIHKFDNDGHELQFMATASGNQDDRNNQNYVNYRNSNTLEWIDTTQTDEKYQSIQVDYSRPWGLIKIETGARSRFRQIDFQNQSFNNPYRPVNQGNNHFLYNDQIHAFYAIGKSKIENWEFQLGLRTEYYRIVTEQLSNNEKNSKSDINFFPTVHISNSAGDNKVMLSYSRRVTRPSVYYLNPYEEWDNDNVRKGNPLLDPEFSHSLEFNYLRYFGQSTASSTIFYRQTDNSISPVQQLYDTTGIVMMTFDNIRKQSSLGVELSMRHSFTQWFQFDGNYSFFYSSIDGQTFGQTVKNDSYNHSVRANLNFKVARNTSISGFVMYNSPSLTAQGKRGAFYNNGLSVRQQILDRKGSITLSVRNPIGKFRWEFEATGNNFYNYFYREPYMPVVTLGFSYKINEGVRKKRANGERSEDFSPDMEL